MEANAYISKLKDNAGNVVFPETRLNAVYDEETGERADQLFGKQVYIFPETTETESNYTTPWHLSDKNDSSGFGERLLEFLCNFSPVDFLYNIGDPSLTTGLNKNIFLPYYIYNSFLGICTVRYLAINDSSSLPASRNITFRQGYSDNGESVITGVTISTTFDSKVQYSAGDIVLLNLKINTTDNTGVFYMASGAATGSGAVPDPENPDNSSLTIGRAKLTWNESTESLDVEIIPKTTDEGGMS